MMNKVKNIILNNFMAIFIVYYCTLFLDTTTLVVDYPIIEIISKITRYLIYIIFGIRIIFLLPEYKKDITKVKWSEKKLIIKVTYILIIILFISLVINLIITHTKRMLFVLLLLLATYKTDYKKIMKTIMNLQIILTSILVLLCILGITQNYSISRGKIIRYSLGFTYTTNLAQMMAFSSILYIYNVGCNIKFKELFVIQLLNVFVNFITDSRTEFIMVQAIIIVTIIWKLMKKMKKEKILKNIQKIYSNIFTRSFVIYPIISLIIVMCYPFGGIWNNLNSVLSNRLRQTYNNIEEYGLKPFGNDVELIGLGIKEKIKYGNYNSNYIDNEYIQMAFREGYVFAISFILLINILLIVLYKRKKYKEIILCSIYLFFGLVNPRIVNVLYCPILFMFITEIIKYSEAKEIQEGLNNETKINN